MLAQALVQTWCPIPTSFIRGIVALRFDGCRFVNFTMAALTDPVGMTCAQGQPICPVSKGTIFMRTRMCAFHASGFCRYGSSCMFAHRKGQLQPQPNLSFTKFCAVMQRTGECSDPNCLYAHTKQERRRLPSGRTMTMRAPQHAAGTDRRDAADSAATAAECLSTPPQACKSPRRRRRSANARHVNDQPRPDDAGGPKPPSSPCETAGIPVPFDAPQMPLPDVSHVMLMLLHEREMHARHQLDQQIQLQELRRLICEQGHLNATQLELPCGSLADYAATGAAGQAQYCREQHLEEVRFSTTATTAPVPDDGHGSTAERQRSVASRATECPEAAPLRSLCSFPSAGTSAAGPPSLLPQWRIDSGGTVDDDDDDEWATLCSFPSPGTSAAGPPSLLPQWRIDSGVIVEDDDDEWARAAPQDAMDIETAPHAAGFCINIKNTFLEMKLQRSPSGSPHARPHARSV
eukprot:NODE_5810_length_1732_cov_15.562617.p1 GENE.NODE_5810_length_1732_cov_15.562617~~NODE_5810_length_1732_cov_15.562617.p1  ORF type:complete len:462 (-),score=58.54 NODE_5810_length_1732_cov_15.562617:347-1732(-)